MKAATVEDPRVVTALVAEMAFFNERYGGRYTAALDLDKDPMEEDKDNRRRDEDGNADEEDGRALHDAGVVKDSFHGLFSFLQTG